MKVSKLMPKSRFTFVIPVVILVAVFFIGYYFYYIPTNKRGCSEEWLPDSAKYPEKHRYKKHGSSKFVRKLF